MLDFLFRRRQAGFTLIELLIVVIIVGILMAIGVPAYLKYVQSAKDRDAQVALRTAYKAAVAGDSETNNSKFPVSTTIVQDIQADEPGFSVARGSCISGLGSASTKQVLVDPASTNSQVVMCIPSASGAIWKLSGPLTGTPTVSDASSVPLTFTGIEITDAARAANVQGDGAPTDSSTGIWESTTNYIPNGGLETNLNGWNATATLTRDTSTAKFGSASAHLVYAGGANFVGAYIDTVGMPSGPLTLSFWMKGTGTITVRLGLNASGNLFDIPLQPTWTRYTLSSTTTGNARAEFSSGFGTAAYNASIDGVQIEPKPSATPYVETNGASATRAAATPSFTGVPLTADQGWIALRMRIGFSSSTALGFGPRPFDWRSCPSSCLIRGLAWNSGTTKWQWAGVGDVGPVQSFNAGDHLTLIAKWTNSPSETLSVSQNGAAFAGITNPLQNGPITSSTLFVGSSGGSPIDSDVFWLATGVGPLTDANAATISTYGDADPPRSLFPASAQATMVWDGVSSSGSLK